MLYLIFLAGEFLKFVPAIRSLSNCGIGEAKATYQHLAKPGRKCHHCNTELGQGPIVDCTKCRAVNLIWEPSNL